MRTPSVSNGRTARVTDPTERRTHLHTEDCTDRAKYIGTALNIGCAAQMGWLVVKRPRHPFHWLRHLGLHRIAWRTEVYPARGHRTGGGPE